MRRPSRDSLSLCALPVISDMFHSFLGLLSFDHWQRDVGRLHPYHWFCCANCTSGWYMLSILLFYKVVVYRCTHQNSHLWLSEPLRPSIEHSSFQLDCGCLPEDLPRICFETWASDLGEKGLFAFLFGACAPLNQTLWVPDSIEKSSWLGNRLASRTPNATWRWIRSHPLSI